MNNGQENGKKTPASGIRKIQLPDGSWGVYMGETGGAGRRPVRKKAPVVYSARTRAREDGPAGNVQPRAGVQKIPERRGIVSRYSLSRDERIAAERNKNEIRRRRAERTSDARGRVPERAPEEKKFYHAILDKIHMWHLGVSVNIDSIIKGVIACALILFFAMLQITVFSKLRPFGATPDLMLPLVIAIGMREGERWGGVSGLAAAFLIDCIGSAGITLLPLLYVPCGFAAGILGTYYLRDSFAIRAIFTAASGVLKAVFTTICVYITYDSPPFGEVMKQIVLPEYLSTAVFAALPHAVSYLAFKRFHKTRADRVQ
ncbi:MAG: hypothetical protein IJT70_06100 [Clostridia bacterium]|nr:hypothetical protein [Clostridia bacterium]